MAAKAVRLIMCMIEMMEEEGEEDDMDDNYDNYDSLVIAAMAAGVKRREAKHRIQNYVQNIVPMYSPDVFKTFFRVQRSTFESILENISTIDSLKVRIPNAGRQQVPLEKDLLMTLWYIGSLESVRSISDRFDVSESTFHQHNRRMLNVFTEHLLKKFIQWPITEIATVSNKFEQRKGFPDEIGAIDCTHIHIKSPSGHAADYLNRKKYHSVVLQAVCREDRRFTDIYAGWPGRVHDARIFRNSSLFLKGQTLCGQCHLLGDGAYPCKKWIMTPYRDTGNLTRNQVKFNRTLSGTRVLIENAFGILKGRFRRLQFVEMTDISYITKLIGLACVLHNMCIVQGDELDEHFNNEAQQIPQDNHMPLESDAEGKLKRILLTRQIANL